MPSEYAERWFLDASVAINILAMPNPEAIVRVLRAPLLLPEQVCREVRSLAALQVTGLAAANVVATLFEVQTLSPDEWATYEGLVSAAAPDGLDDGEAAALALAIHRGGGLLVDERKARRVAAARAPRVSCVSTVELLMRAEVAGLARDEVAKAAVSALQHARMRVTHDQVEWILGLVGRDVASQCPSIPRRRSL